MSKIDILIALLILVGGYLGYKKGFLMELFFFGAIVLGVLIGFRLMGAGVEYLKHEFHADTTYLPYISFLIIFIAIVLVVVIIGKSIKNSVDQTFLGRMDQIAGAILGAAKYAFCISVLLWLAGSLNLKFPVGWTRGSWLYPVIASFAPKIAGFFGGFLHFFKEIFKRY